MVRGLQENKKKSVEGLARRRGVRPSRQTPEWYFSLQVAMSGSNTGRRMIDDDVVTTPLCLKRSSTVGTRMENYHEG